MILPLQPLWIVIGIGLWFLLFLLVTGIIIVGVVWWVINSNSDSADAEPTGDPTATSKDDATVTDPVCGMTVETETASAEADYHGDPYHFCSEICKDQFKEDPEQYL